MSSNWIHRYYFTSYDSWVYNLEVKKHLRRKLVMKIKFTQDLRKFEEFTKQQEVRFKKKSSNG